MKGTTEETQLPVLRGEAALLGVVVVNSLGVQLMLHSGSGISAISSLPYAFSLVLPQLTLGTWTYLFQGLLVLSLMVLQRRFIPSYLFSFVVGFAFGKMLDVYDPWVSALPAGADVSTHCNGGHKSKQSPDCLHNIFILTHCKCSAKKPYGT